MLNNADRVLFTLIATITFLCSEILAIDYGYCAQTFVHPTKSPQNINCLYSSTNCFKTGSHHTGIDYKYDKSNRDVIASNDGIIRDIVHTSASDHAMGNTVIIEHNINGGERVYSLYAHLAEIDKSLVVGKEIHRGDIVGKVGGSGKGKNNYWSPHLHFEIKSLPVTSNPQNPNVDKVEWWGYTPNSPDLYGYHDPNKYINIVEIMPLQTERNIRSVDFKNFTYSSGELRQAVKVRNGEYIGSTKSGGKYSMKATVSVEGVYYTDINGDGYEDAVVSTYTYFEGANYSVSEFYIYRMSKGTPVLMDHLTDEKINKDYKAYYPGGYIWYGRDGIDVQNGTIYMKYYAEGCHAIPDYYATMSYRWNGKMMALSGTPKRTKIHTK